MEYKRKSQESQQRFFPRTGWNCRFSFIVSIANWWMRASFACVPVVGCPSFSQLAAQFLVSKPKTYTKSLLSREASVSARNKIKDVSQALPMMGVQSNQKKQVRTSYQDILLKNDCPTSGEEIHVLRAFRDVYWWWGGVRRQVAGMIILLVFVLETCRLQTLPTVAKGWFWQGGWTVFKGKNKRMGI